MNTENNNKIYSVYIKTESYDFKLLDIAMKTIYNCLIDGGIQCNPPRPLMTKNVKFTIRRAPSIYKSSFEKFVFRIHSRLLVIKNTDNLDKLICLSKADIPKAVNIDIKILTQTEIENDIIRRREIRKKINLK